MKRTFHWTSFIILTFTFMVLIAFGPLSTATAELNFNVQDYTDEELVEIMTIIQQADTKLGILYSSDILVVGTDIPAGHYEFWVEEEDIGFSQEFIEDPRDYHCGASTLCYVKWGKEYNKYSYDNYEEFFYDEYGTHKMVTLEEGQYLWASESLAGANFVGLRMKYFPTRQSGLF